MTSNIQYQKSPLLKSSINNFAKTFGLSHKEDELFECFAGYVLSSMHCDKEILDPECIHNGGSNDQGIDSIAIIVNGILITKLSDVDRLRDLNVSLNVKYIFVQAKNKPDFSNMTSQISNFIDGVELALDQSAVPQDVIDNSSEKFKNFVELKAEIEDSGNLESEPELYLYFVTVADSQGKQSIPESISTRYKVTRKSLEDNYKIGSYEIVDAPKLIDLYRKVKNKSEATFRMDTLHRFNPTHGDSSDSTIDSVYFGYLPLGEYLKIIHDDLGRIRPSVFYDNVRSYMGGTKINKSIKESLDGAMGGPLFFARNNGVTITAKNISIKREQMTIHDYSIVNGCQTSHILSEYYNGKIEDSKKIESEIPDKYRGNSQDQLMEMFRNREIESDNFMNIYDNIKNFDDMKSRIERMESSICIPVRIVCSSDEELISSITESTNRQNAIKSLNLESRSDFHKNLEAYFNGKSEYNLLYERLEGSAKPGYDYINLDSLMRAFSSVFLREPHLAARNRQTIEGYLDSQDTEESKRKVFSVFHNRASYYLVAKIYADLINRTSVKNMKDKDERNKNRRYKWHILYSMFIELRNSMPKGDKVPYDPSNLNALQSLTISSKENTVDRYINKYLQSDFENLYSKAYDRLNIALKNFENQNPVIEKGEISKNSALVDFIAEAK